MQYGYSLRQALAQRGMPIEEGTLYPLLRRLEGQGLLASEWRIEGGKLKMRVVVPPNVEAQILIPTITGSKRMETVGSGEYFFEEPWSR